MKKDELVDRLDRRLGRLKRAELERLVERVEAGSLDLAAAGETPAPRTTTEPAQLSSLNDVLMEQVRDLHSAERQLVNALPRLARAATKPELRQAFEQHLEQTKGHVRRLERIFGDVGVGTPAEQCEGMQGLLAEGETVLTAKGDPAAKDAALIAAAQRVEHYEIAAYGTARTLAGELGLDEAKRLLDETLDEESRADELLTRIATGGRFGSGVNEEAAPR